MFYPIESESFFVYIKKQSVEPVERYTFLSVDQPWNKQEENNIWRVNQHWTKDEEKHFQKVYQSENKQEEKILRRVYQPWNKDEEKQFCKVDQPQNEQKEKQFWELNSPLDQYKMVYFNKLNEPFYQLEKDSLVGRILPSKQSQIISGNHSANDLDEVNYDHNYFSFNEINQSRAIDRLKQKSDSSVQFDSSENEKSSNKGINFSNNLSQSRLNKLNKIWLTENDSQQQIYQMSDERSSRKNLEQNDELEVEKSRTFNQKNTSYYSMKQQNSEDINLSQSSIQFKGSSSEENNAFSFIIQQIGIEMSKLISENQLSNSFEQQQNDRKESQKCKDLYFKLLKQLQQLGQNLNVDLYLKFKRSIQDNTQLIRKQIDLQLGEDAPEQVLLLGQTASQSWFNYLEFMKEICFDQQIMDTFLKCSPYQLRNNEKVTQKIISAGKEYCLVEVSYQTFSSSIDEMFQRLTRFQHHSYGQINNWKQFQGIFYSKMDIKFNNLGIKFRRKINKGEKFLFRFK